MLSLATAAAIAPFILGIQASVVKDVPRDVTPDVTPDEAAYPPYPPVTGQPGYGNIDCNQYNDWQCFKDFFDRYKYCHPYDTRCYQDCNDYDDYRGRCSERGYGQCYDKCYYDHDGCDKWKHCREDDPECYRKKRPDGDYGHDHCQPWDWECHKKEHHHDYPDYDDHHDDHHDDDYDDYDDGEYDGHPEPKHHIAVKYFGPYGSWEQRVWPDGDEAWTDHDDFLVEYIKTYAEKEEEEVRCLPMKSWYPWTPLPIEEYREKGEYGRVVRVLKLHKPQPVEVIRCDYP